MTQVLVANVAGIARGEPRRLPSRRRRLATIARRYGPADRRFILSVHRKGETAFVPTDANVRLRATWAKTLVGPHDVVLITVLPLGGGGGGGGGGKSGVGIGAALAAVALMALAPYIAPAIAGALTTAGLAVSAGAVQTGLVIGGLALSFAARLANSSKKKDTSQEIYSISGGGNVPRPGQRKPLQYGRCWSAPPLSQPDFTIYNSPTSMLLIKRMTLGIGQYDVHTIRVGNATLWADGAIQPPFNGSSSGGVTAAVEILFGTSSAIAPNDVISSPDVSGQTLPRAGSNPEWTPWFRVAPLGVMLSKIQLDMQWPAGLIHNSSKGAAVCLGRMNFEARRVDPITGAPTGEYSRLFEIERIGKTTTAVRHTQIVDIAVPGCFEVRAQNAFPDQPDYENRASWDGLRGWTADTRVRPNTTEIVISIPALEGLSVSSFSDLQVDASRKVPVWHPLYGWLAPEATSKAVWAWCDLVRSEYGLNLTNGADVQKALAYAGAFGTRDTYDGVLPEVSSFWEAASEVLGPLRADPIKVGSVHSFVRDESHLAPRHVISRRQIVEDSGQASYSFVQDAGDGSDVIVEFSWGGDPQRPGEVRYSYGPRTRTPKRYKVPGIVDGTHALSHAKWLAAVATFRGSTRKITTEWDGRLVAPGDQILCDLWFIAGKQVYGATAVQGNVLHVDCDITSMPANAYVSLRRRNGREWGPVRVENWNARAIVLFGPDVTAEIGRTGVGPDGVIATDAQDPTTVVVGTLVELQKTYVARSAIPADEDHVTIEMVLDDTRVWSLLEEPIFVPQPPIADTGEDPLIPVLDTLHARCERIETSIEVIWSVTLARGAVSYEVDLSYDAADDAADDHWEPLSRSAMRDGRATIRQSDEPITVRARPIGRTGLAGAYLSVTFLTQAPSVDGNLLEPLSVTLAKLQAQVRIEIESISRAGKDAILAGQGTVRDELKRLDEKLEKLAADAATESGTSYERRELIKLQVRNAFAAIEDETRLRVGADEALAELTTTLGTRLTTAEGELTSQAAAIQGLSTSVTLINGTLASHSLFLTDLDSRVTTAEGQIAGQATAVQQLSTRVSQNRDAIEANAQALTVLQAQATGTATAVQSLSTTVTNQGGQISAAATSITALTTTVAGNTSTLTTFGQSLNGVSAKWGVTWELNGQAQGGIVLTGMVKNDGTGATTFGVMGDMVVTGTISGTKLQVYDIIAYSAQIGSLTVDHLSVKDGAITTMDAVASGEQSAAIARYVRGNGRVLLSGMFVGAPGSYKPLTVSAGRLVIRRNGLDIANVGASFEASGSGSSAGFALLPTPVMAVDQPGEGTHTYEIYASNNAGIGGVILVVAELSK